MIHNEYVKQVTSTSYHIARIVEQELDVVGGSINFTQLVTVESAQNGIL